MYIRNALKNRIAFCTVLALLLSVMLFMISAGDSTVESYESKISKLEKEQKEIQARINAAKKDAKDAAAAKKNLDEEMLHINDKIDTTLALIEEYEREIEKIGKSIAKNELESERKLEAYKARLRVNYEDSFGNYLDVILGSEDMADMLVRVERVGRMLEYETKLLKEIETLKDSLVTDKAALDDLYSKQQDQKKELEGDRVVLEGKVEEAVSLLKTSNLTAAQEQERLEEVQAAEEALSIELENYLKELAKKQQSAYVGGEFIWPVELSNKRISSQYANRISPITGKKEYHNGIDIPAPYGSNVYASNSGTVIKSEWHYSYGYYVMIDHGGGNSTLYAHNSKLLVKVGDKVKQGDVIARIGSTGHSTGNHCHFSVYINGSHVDPLGYVVRP